MLIAIVPRICAEWWHGFAKGAFNVMQMSSFNISHLNQLDYLQ